MPANHFEEVGKQHTRGSAAAPAAAAHDSGFSEKDNSSFGGDGVRMSKLGRAGQGAMVYGIVQYDFQAERPDELDAKAGEAIIVIAQSNQEWFVAKPIQRLGGPGLIPVSFIEIRDMTTGTAVADPSEAVRRAGVPKVEEWKKMAAEYKNSSIPLGKLEMGAQQQQLTQGMDRMSINSSRQSQAAQNGAYVSSNPLPDMSSYSNMHTHTASAQRKPGAKHQSQRAALVTGACAYPRPCPSLCTPQG